MNLKLMLAISLIAAAPAFAQGQMGGPQQKVAKPTVAQVKKVLDAIAADKTKLATYCQLAKLNAQISQVDPKDEKKMNALGEQADKLQQQLGPDYGKVMDGLDAVDENSAEGKQYAALFAPLDGQCK
jgi:hypothetical protein